MKKSTCTKPSFMNTRQAYIASASATREKVLYCKHQIEAVWKKWTLLFSLEQHAFEWSIIIEGTTEKLEEIPKKTLAWYETLLITNNKVL